MAESKLLKNRKIRPGLSIDPCLWRRFRERYGDRNASQKVEELMRNSIDPPEIPPALFSSNGVENFSFNNPDQWNLSFTDSKIQLTNISYSCTSEGNTTDATTSNIQIHTNIEIE